MCNMRLNMHPIETHLISHKDNPIYSRNSPPFSHNGCTLPHYPPCNCSPQSTPPAQAATKKTPPMQIPFEFQMKQAAFLASQLTGQLESWPSIRGGEEYWIPSTPESNGPQQVHTNSWKERKRLQYTLNLSRYSEEPTCNLKTCITFPQTVYLEPKLELQS